MTVLCINKVEVSVGLERHIRPVGLWWPDISKLDSPRDVTRHPRQQLHLESIRPGPPPQLVNVGADEPMKGCSGGGAEENDSRSHRALEDHVQVRRRHEGDNRAQRHGEAARRKGQKLDLLNGGRNRPIVDYTLVFLIIPVFVSFAWTDTYPSLVFSHRGLRRPSSLRNIALPEGAESRPGVWPVCQYSVPIKSIP